MLTLADVVGSHAQSADLTEARVANIIDLLLPACADLERRMLAAGVEFPVNPQTGSGVSGQTFGGFRPQSCCIGAPRSNHKEGLAVDRYDPFGKIDAWLLDHQDVMAECGIWIESPGATPGWSHWQVVSPKSGRRVFLP